MRSFERPDDLEGDGQPAERVDGTSGIVECSRRAFVLRLKDEIQDFVILTLDDTNVWSVGKPPASRFGCRSRVKQSAPRAERSGVVAGTNRDASRPLDLEHPTVNSAERLGTKRGVPGTGDVVLAEERE